MKDLSLEQIDAGIEAVILNAESLITEAQLLQKNAFHARAYALAHFAREELAKVTMLHAAGVRLILGHAVDWKKLQRRLRDHKAKLQSDALLQLTSIASEIAGQEKQLLTAMVSGASTRNVWKNDSLYVGFVDGEFVLPSRAITPRKAERTIALAQLTLTDAKQFRVVLGQLRERSPAQVREAFKHLPTLDALPAGDVTELFLRVLKVWATLQKSHASQK